MQDVESRDGYLKKSPSHVEVIDSAKVIWRELNAGRSKCGGQLVDLIYIILNRNYLLLESLEKHKRPLSTSPQILKKKQMYWINILMQCRHCALLHCKFTQCADLYSFDVVLKIIHDHISNGFPRVLHGFSLAKL